ncbi:hypothetical protein SAMN05444920_11978 [Nonomuraea solani]|uniref:DNRLRE domain-containing protein n=2 Tax=Nonomuraea solani TaxID=1144553 RepID=A0A1H6ETF9_9ACTN|nr:hypothetical protein SAMN05444920_11978 [Nonomuraea solani]
MVTLAAVTPAAAQTGLAVNPTAWASVTSQDPDQAHWSEYEPTWEGADVSVGRTDHGEVTRAFFELDVTAFAGKRVLDANFVLYVRAHGACGPDTEMWETGRISSQTTWNDQPQWLRELSTSPADCGVQGWMISEAVKDAVARGDEVVTIGLKSADESTAGRYVFWTTPSVGNATGPGMSVRYNTVPDVPSGQAVTAGDCQAPPGGPYLRTTTPSFLAMLTDPDHGGNEIMRGRFEWADAAGAKIGEAVTTEQTGDARHCVTVPAGQLADGGSYTWRVRAENSYTVVGPGGYETYWDMGEWSAWQPELHIDQAPPANPPAISSADFPENQVGGRVGQPGTFTLAPNGVTDVASYDYDFGRGFVPVRAGADGTATVTFTPTNTFPQRLIARSVDRAGNLGPTVTYAFRAAPR